MEEFVTKYINIDRSNETAASSFNDQPRMNSVKIHLNTQNTSYDAINSQILTTKKQKEENPYKIYFPTFYKKELRNSYATLIAWIVILTLATAGCCWMITNIVTSPVVNNWTILALVPLYGLAVGLFIFYLIKYLNFKSESKTINFKDEKVISINVSKLYKSLKVGYININWMSLLSYTISLITLFVTCIICYIQYPTYFGDVITPITLHNNYAFVVIFWGCVAVVIGTFIMQVCMLLGNYIRYTRIENFYNFVIINEEEITNLKKKTNRRDALIYFAISFTLILIVWLIVKLFKRNKKTKVVVNA
uniref:Uncharacterized protein n=1 Tax=uncultured Mycoplasmataceae bacterium TaxID=300027 RepID=A0A6G9HHQ4_9MOLU|nr:hypothetical protein PlMoll_1110 [uncultured Mycoplasmataceae bacterium]